ncbi:septum formation family protein [Corynebacterium lizhenjunii]|uniref:Septum formation family protein n=1 Tax=Corynebacterium lizhenjunii TaxID=2709394 RepID=A0A7T0KDY9_9CORY|nr:septum formation family protein [Corynebacterium lizhenjunii]QPK79025.1 septum formation family protein [Corynebacterium lizhenjunii]
MTSSKPFRTLRSPLGMSTLLISAASAAAFLGVYDTMSDSISARDTTISHSTGSSIQPAGEVTPFTTADAGSCLHWQVGPAGEVSDFAQTDCQADHRFEVSSREDLAVYPTSEFGQDAPMPDQARQAQLREELCHGATLQYLDGHYDPAGKYSIAPILPPAQAWKDGDRTMLCGLQTTDEHGTALITQGRVAESDQANIAREGECRAVDEAQVLRTVDCTQPHHLETVSVVNLAERFPEGTPSIDEQNHVLTEVCTAAAEAYLGGEEQLYQSTLQPYWGSITESSWEGGTRSVNCSLMHAAPGSAMFSTITGSAKGGRAALSINGAPPTPQPERKPLRSQLGSAQPAPAQPADAPTADAPAPAPSGPA